MMDTKKQKGEKFGEKKKSQIISQSNENVAKREDRTYKARKKGSVLREEKKIMGSGRNTLKNC